MFKNKLEGGKQNNAYAILHNTTDMLYSRCMIF